MGDGEDASTPSGERNTVPPPKRYGAVVAASHREGRSRESRGSVSGRHQRPLRVLVAEANPEHRSSLLLALGKAGFDALGMSNGRHAVNSIVTRAPDAIIANLALPQLSGDVFLGWAQKRLGKRLLAAILTTVTTATYRVPDTVLVVESPFVSVVIDALQARVASSHAIFEQAR